MRHFPASLVLALALWVICLPGWAQSLADDDGAAIMGTISRQIEAFRRDDGAAAFSLAAPAIQQMYGSPERFLEAVRQTYRPVYRPRQVEFRQLGLVNGAIVQRVYLVGPDDQPSLALYFMEKQSDGSWRISGCVLLAIDGRSV